MPLHASNFAEGFYAVGHAIGHPTERYDVSAYRPVKTSAELWSAHPIRVDI